MRFNRNEKRWKGERMTYFKDLDCQFIFQESN
nr:MAG TPA: hypothetical protein [Caudoviricetes sp.]DAR67249.1 MAG TPA: hypothetical protein [Caudoviricetes sp.]